MAYTLALAGNPNTGKTTIFNALTGLRQKVGNYPGITVDKKMGKFSYKQSSYQIIDLPGTYSLHPTSKDENIVLQYLLTEPIDALVYVADANDLERHLLLFTQIYDLGLSCILVINMTDLAQTKGININEKILQQKLNVPVVFTNGRTGEGLNELKATIAQLKESGDKHTDKVGRNFFYSLNKKEKQLANNLIHEHSDLVANQRQALMLAHHYQAVLPAPQIKPQLVKQLANIDFLDWQVQETMSRYMFIDTLVAQAISKVEQQDTSFTKRVDTILTHKLIGPIIFGLLMLFVFQAIFAWASYPMDLIDALFSTAIDLVYTTLPDSWFSSLLADGILAGLGGVLIFIPQIAILFFFISLLEEVGYMSRVVYLFDRLMQRFGLNGRSMVSLISGGACAIPAIMAARTISNWKERLITIMVTPLISCSARIPVYTVLIAFAVPYYQVGGFLNSQGLAFMGLYALSVLMALISAYIFKLVLRNKESSYLMLILPEYQPPVWRNVGLTVFEKVKTFVVEAGRIIIVVSIVLWVLANFGPPGALAQAEQRAQNTAQIAELNEEATANLVAAQQLEASFAGQIGKFVEPVIAPLGFDWKVGIALLTSFAAREVFVGTMATIYSIGSESDENSVIARMEAEKDPATGEAFFTPAVSWSLLIFYVFALQCMSTVAVVKRETKSWTWPTIQFVYMTALAYFGSLLVYTLLS